MNGNRILAHSDADVIVVGAGPTGLMLACELRLAGARPLVLEKRVDPSGAPRANGFSGQILRLLDYRGLLERLEALSSMPVRAAGFPFGGIQVSPPSLADSPLRALPLPQRRLEDVLAERAVQLGIEVRRGHEVTGLEQTDEAVSLDVRGPEGNYHLDSGYVVGCDGSRSVIRELAGIGFPGTTYPEVNRLGQLGLADTVTVSDNGNLDVPGHGSLEAGFTRTERGAFAFGLTNDGGVLVQTTEDEHHDYEDETMSVGELHDSIRRVLGFDVPFGEPSRLSRYQLQARRAERYAQGRVLLAGDAAHQFPATGIGINMGMTDAANLGWKLAALISGWAPPDLLETYEQERQQAADRAMFQTEAQVALRRGHDAAAQALRDLVLEILQDEEPFGHLAAMIAGTDLHYATIGGHAPAGAFVPDLSVTTPDQMAQFVDLMQNARPVFLDLAGRREFESIALDWKPRVHVHVATLADRPVDAMLIRPDGYVAWAADLGESVVTGLPRLRDALTRWFGESAR
jgi:2-polyprenyl-6-methoxyphenol hydroxylase-like FAD-dependent oxidoreductase